MAALVMALPSAVRAQDDDDDHDRARDLHERGEIEGLADIMAIVRAKAPGEIVSVDLIRAEGKWIYRFRWSPPTAGAGSLTSMPGWAVSRVMKATDEDPRG
ncbi:hypothetical protein [Mesorhizobium sp.]|uniref:PepSY domain-containing protein n=1 Tax=Mesorhizobium sp. TaxID=1871066 RepID=UPI0025BA2A85|nr:hypothetical protein [Mesorhizobium sp.]